MHVTIRTTDVATLLAVRHAVLRPGLPVAAARYDTDAAADTTHFGAFADDGRGGGDRLIGCVTVHPEPLTTDTAADQPGWRLRGMAVTDAAQGLGVGRRLVDAVVRHATAAAPDLVWCNARATAIGFYERCGWTTVSDFFDIAGVGPHRKMAIRR